MLTYSNDTFGGGFIIDTSLDEFGNKVGAARNMEYICIDKRGGRLEMDTVVDGGGSRVGVGRVDVVEEVGGRNNDNNSVGGSEVADVETGGVGGVDNNNDNNKQQHVTTHTTHNTHTYSKSIIRNTSKHHTTDTKRNAEDQQNNDEHLLIDLLQTSVRREGERPIARVNHTGRGSARQNGLSSAIPAGDSRVVDTQGVSSLGGVDCEGDSVGGMLGDVSVGDGGFVGGGVEEDCAGVEADCLGSVGHSLGLGSLGHNRGALADIGVHATVGSDLVDVIGHDLQLAVPRCAMDTSNQTRRWNDNNKKNLDNDSKIEHASKKCTVGLIGPQTRHLPSDSGDDLTAPESEVNAPRLGEREPARRADTEREPAEWQIKNDIFLVSS